MVRLALAILALGAIVLGDGVTPSDLDLARADPVLTPKCKAINDAIDQCLEDSNSDMEDQGADHMWVDYYGFKQDLNLYAFGYRLPTKVSLSVSNGTLHNLNTLTRIGDSLQCSTPISTTLEGKYTYRSSLNLTYQYLTAKFLFWEVKGSFTYKPRLIVHTAFLNGSFDCRSESFELVSQGQRDYIITTENDSWTGWLIEKIVRRALFQEDNTPLFTTVLSYSQGFIDSSFREAWCDLYSPDIH